MGAFAGSGQPGKIEMTDDGGDSVGVRPSGHNWRGEKVLSYELTLLAP